MEDQEAFWRKKIADEVELAWENFVLKNYYTSNLATKMIIEFIREGDRDSL
jgi:hypothetical protein